MESKPISVRMNDVTSRLLDEACERLDCTRTDFIVAAVEWALERENEPHTPAQVQNAAMVIDMRGRVKMPKGRTMPLIRQLPRSSGGRYR
jgi:hypothetical protein